VVGLNRGVGLVGGGGQEREEITAYLLIKNLVPRDGGSPPGEGPRLVKHHVADLVGALQRVRPLDEDAVGGRHPCAHHHGGGRCQTQGAGAGDDQHGDAEQHGKQEGVVALQGGFTPSSVCCVLPNSIQIEVKTNGYPLEDRGGRCWILNTKAGLWNAEQRGDDSDARNHSKNRTGLWPCYICFAVYNGKLAVLYMASWKIAPPMEMGGGGGFE